MFPLTIDAAVSATDLLSPMSKAIQMSFDTSESADGSSSSSSSTAESTAVAQSTQASVLLDLDAEFGLLNASCHALVTNIQRPLSSPTSASSSTIMTDIQERFRFLTYLLTRSSASSASSSLSVLSLTDAQLLHIWSCVVTSDDTSPPSSSSSSSSSSLVCSAVHRAVLSWMLKILDWFVSFRCC
jgi:hypothetical protein